MRFSGLPILLLLANSALAHIPLTPAIIDDAFEEIDQARDAVTQARSRDTRAAAIYDFAIEATKLMELLNQEIQLHGFEQRELLNDAVANANSQGIGIVWSEQHERYFYKGGAFRRYLDLVPEGLDAANSLYHLIETGFYLGDPEDRAELLARIDMSRNFLQRYGGLDYAEQVTMFLAIDYRDLWRLCSATGDAECASRYARLNRTHLEAAIDRHGDARTGRLARSFLDRFDAEIAAQDTPSNPMD